MMASKQSAHFQVSDGNADKSIWIDLNAYRDELSPQDEKRLAGIAIRKFCRRVRGADPKACTAQFTGLFG
jgi:hypothetical protein